MWRNNCFKDKQNGMLRICCFFGWNNTSDAILCVMWLAWWQW